MCQAPWQARGGGGCALVSTWRSPSSVRAGPGNKHTVQSVVGVVKGTTEVPGGQCAAGMSGTLHRDTSTTPAARSLVQWGWESSRASSTGRRGGHSPVSGERRQGRWRGQGQPRGTLERAGRCQPWSSSASHAALLNAEAIKGVSGENHR